MKEFTEKLIGRLEEISVSRDNDGVINGCNMGICEDDDCLKCLKKKVISIVNQLAEEYSTDTPQKSAGGWIPCSERLPNREEYLKNNGRFIVTDGNRIYVTHFDIYETQKFGVPQLHGFCEDGKVIAWMPIPAPYKENENGKI